jgi:hypothetical protein
MEPVPTYDAGFRTALYPCNAVPRVPHLSQRASRFLKRLSTALKRARDVLKHSPGLPNPAEEGSEGRFHGLEGGMNSPVGGIGTSEARVSHRVGSKRTQ